jgi:hypothetical protein
VRDEDTKDSTADNEPPDILSGLAHEPEEKLGTWDHHRVFPGTNAFGKCQKRGKERNEAHEGEEEMS